MDASLSAAAEGLASCHVCGKVSPVENGDCPRCQAPLHLRKPHSLQRTWAFLIAAATLYLPANLMPIMTIHQFGGPQNNTILSGVITFWQMKAYPVAIVIFTASVLIPILKMAALVWLCLAAQGRTAASPKALSRVYHVTEILGRWSMVDIFVVSILVCLVRMGVLLNITPGPAAPSFAGVVILTMFAAMSFVIRALFGIGIVRGRRHTRNICMSEDKTDPGEPSAGGGKPEPHASVRRTHRWSSVWVVPIVAFALAGWLVWQHYIGQGVLVHVQFNTADGVAADKTEVRCRSVKVGMVEAAKISEDLKNVVISIRIEPDEEKLLRPGSRFWVVRPRVSGTDISGLGTLFTGSYIELDPGDAGEMMREYKGLEEPPVTSSNVPGLRITLTADEAGSLSVGSPVYFKGFEVGDVERSTFDLKEKRTRFDIFIPKEYAELVHEGTCFWNTSGIDVSAGADGFHIRTLSFRAMISGGVTFSVPPDGVPGNVAANGTVFRLFKDEVAARDSVFHPEKEILLLFNQSVRGLTKGAPVEFRGLTLGRVKDVSFKYAPEGEKRVPVLIEIDPKILRDAVQDRQEEKGFLATAVSHGLRAKLGTGSLITGSLFIDIDFVPEAPPSELWHYGTYDVLPTVSSGLVQLEAKVNAILDKIQALPIEDTLGKFGKTAESIAAAGAEARAALDQLHQLLAKDETQKIPAELDATLDQVRAAVTSLGPTGAVQGDLRRSLDELRAALRSMKILMDSIEQKPNSLIFGGEKNGNPTPRARKP